MAQQNCCPGTCPGNDCFKEAVCIDTQRIYDSCGDKECIEGLQVFFFGDDQDLIDHALIVKAKKVEIIDTFIEVEPVPFDNGFFSVDITYFFKVTLAIYNCPTAVPTIVHGLATFSKKVILFGSEGSVRTFSSEGCANHHGSSSLPCATVQVVDPLVLASRIEDAPVPPRGCGCVCPPPCVANHFNGCLSSCSEPRKIVTIALGIFSIIQLSRRVQLLMPAFDFCIPCKDCAGVSGTEEPCDLFDKIKFPTDEFFPPKLFQEGCSC